METVDGMLQDLVEVLGAGELTISADGLDALCRWCAGDCRDGRPRAEFRGTFSGGRLWHLLLATAEKTPVYKCLNDAGELDAEGVGMLEAVMFSGTRYCTDPASA